MVNLAAIPSQWKTKATPYIPMLVNTFQQEGIASQAVCAYACASISNESSWNPKAENTTDGWRRTLYSGKGLAQVTSDRNYQAISNLTGIDFFNQPFLMFEPELSLRAKAVFFKMNHMVSYIEQGDYESAAGIYNGGKPTVRSDYTHRVASSVPLWMPVFNETNDFSSGSSILRPPILGDYPQANSHPRIAEPPHLDNHPPQFNSAATTHAGVYIVQPGDNFYKIATKHFGVSVARLQAANPQIVDISNLAVGQVINAPV